MSDGTAAERILVVDDQADTRELLVRNLHARGYVTVTAADVQEALRLLDEHAFELVVTDYRMPGASGLELVRYVRENLPGTVVMMITGYASVPGAVEALKTGAEEYLAKPFTDEELYETVGRALERGRVRRAGLRVVESFEAPAGLLGESPGMKAVHRAILRAAEVPATVLVTGESGTGKELVARAVHYASARASFPFVPVNCGSIPESLLESELFGHMKGAFTGATTSRAGFFQTAEGGTLFLDEISETSPATQVKLLRVLQDKEVCMVGSTRPRRVDVRIIAATNRDLRQLVGKEAFREDLYFRLQVLEIAIPPLRERGTDVVLLARHFLREQARDLGRPEPRFTDEALDLLLAHTWPGNVRELENLVQRLLVMSDAERIDVADLPLPLRTTRPRENHTERTLQQVEAEHIARTLEQYGGNKTQAARALGIDRKTLRSKLEQHGLGT